MLKLENHFSLADWDYAVPGPYISDTVYISPPTSLAARKEAPFDREGWAFCNLSPAQNIFDGRIVSYIRLGSGALNHLFWSYRAQANPPSPLVPPDNCYMLGWSTSIVNLYRRLAGVNTLLASHSFTPNLLGYTWYYFRVTWWQYLQPDMTKLLRHRIEQYLNGNWVTLFDYDDSQNSWADSAVNKVGFLLLHKNQIYETAIDNSEIWKRIE